MALEIPIRARLGCADDRRQAQGGHMNQVKEAAQDSADMKETIMGTYGSGKTK